MANRNALGLVIGVMVGLGAAAACSNYVPPDVGTYGPPGALSGKSPPVPEVDDAGSGVVTPPAGDSGTAPPGGGVTYACQVSGGTIVDGGATCTVSFAKDIYPNMQTGGSLGCAATTCHGGVQAPSVAAPVPQTPAGYYAVFADFTKLSDGKGLPYFDPCSTDPTQSDFVCNTEAAGTCGSQMPVAKTLSAADSTTIATWVACGAPDN